MTGDATGKGKLGEQFFHPLFVLRNVWVQLAVGALQIGIGDQARTAMPRTSDIDHVQVMLVDDTVQMDVDEVQPRSGAPVTEQARLHMLKRQVNPEQWVVVQIDLPNREIVGCTPIGVHICDEFRRQGFVHRPIPRSESAG